MVLQWWIRCAHLTSREEKRIVCLSKPAKSLMSIHLHTRGSAGTVSAFCGEASVVTQAVVDKAIDRFSCLSLGQLVAAADDEGSCDVWVLKKGMSSSPKPV